MRNLLYFLFFLLALPSLKAQTNPADDKVLFLNKKNQHSISLEGVALSYTYVHQMYPNLNLGLRIQAGVGIKFLLKQHHFFELDKVVDVIKLQLIYRKDILNNFYFDIGPLAAIGIGENLGFSSGIDLTSYYQIKKVHIGFRIEGILYFYNNKSDFVGITIIPIVMGINF